jgi:chromosome segregation ATPase
MARAAVQIRVLKRELDRKLAQRADLRRALAEMPSTGGPLHAKRQQGLSTRITELGRQIEHLRGKIRELEKSAPSHTE